MNGPAHYKEAERLLGDLRNVAAGGNAEADLIGEAQVHATLAHVAVMADMAAGADTFADEQERLWMEAVSDAR